MKVIIKICTILILPLLTTCANLYTFHSNTIKADKVLIKKSMNELTDVILSHDVDVFLSYVEVDYKKEQLDGFLEGRKEQFLNEFFCGNTKEENNFYCIKFNKITACKLISIKETEVGYYTIIYLMKDESGKTVEAEVYGKYINGKMYLFSAMG